MRLRCATMLVLLVACDGSRLRSNSVRTEPIVSRIAFGSCAYQFEPQPIMRAVVASEPDLFLYLGDAIYGDWDGESVIEVTPESLKREWQKLADNPDFQHLKTNVPLLATWDNHDYGKHDGGAEFPLKEESRQIFLDFFGESSDSIRRASPGLYDSIIYGPAGKRLQVILLDTRYFKGPHKLAERSEGAKGSLGKYAPNDDPDATLLGEDQWSWLAEQLRVPADLRLIASSTQIIADQKGMDEWGNYPSERRRLFEVIGETGATGVLFISGNVHYSEISASAIGPYLLTDFTSSGLTHVNEIYPEVPSSYRIAGPYVGESFGLVEIDWHQRTVELSAIGLDGAVQFRHQVPFASLAAAD